MSSSDDYEIYYRSRKRNSSCEASKLQSNAYKMQLQRFEIFKAQDPENGDFDFTLLFGEKKIFVHKFMVTSVSETLNSMFSIRWNKNVDGTMKIENYSYDDFFQFICFLYSGGCALTEGNILQLIDMAEFYGVETMKDFCDSFLSKMDYKKEDFYDMVEFEGRYSLKCFNKSLRSYFSSKLLSLIGDEKFNTLDKHIMKCLTTFPRPCYHEEDFFQAVYKWAHQQASNKQEAFNDEKFDMSEAIKNEMSELLPQIEFSKISFTYLKKFVVENEFIFSHSELYDALMSSKRDYNQEQNLFAFMYNLVEKHVLEKQNITPDFNSDEAWKMAFVGIIPRFKYVNIKFRFLLSYPAEKQHLLFSPMEFRKALSTCEKNHATDVENAFKRMYESAEKEALEKHNSSSVEDNFNVNEVIKNELVELLDNFCYYRMSLNFMVEFIVPRSFLFYHVDLIRMLFGAHDIKQEILFETVYKLAENEATKKQALSLDADFNFDDTIKREMIRVLSKFKFDEMNLKFVVEFVVVKRFLFSVQQLYDLLIKCQRNANQEEIFFKAVYMLAEKSVMEKQEVNLAENFDMKSAVKEEMMKYLYHFKFSLMSLEFLTDFVVDRGFIFNAIELNKFFLSFRKNYTNEAESFRAIYLLAKKQAHQKQMRSPLNFNVVQTIKEDLFITLPNVQYYIMDETFLMDFVVKNGILSIDDALHVYDYRVVITNNGKTITGSFVDTFGIKNALGTKGYGIAARAKYKQRFTRLKFAVPTIPSPLRIMKGGQWYLLLEKDGFLSLKFARYVANDDYLIAEMRSQDERFELTLNTPTTIKTFVNDKT